VPGSREPPVGADCGRVTHRGPRQASTGWPTPNGRPGSDGRPGSHGQARPAAPPASVARAGVRAWAGELIGQPAMRVLTVNAGSSSLKLAIVEGDGPEARAGVMGPTGQLGRPGDPGVAEGLRRFVEAAGGADATAHRIVHGGREFRGPVLVDDRVRHRLDGLGELAPLHNPPALAALAVVEQVLGDLPAVACFDTSFHAGLSTAAATYALPREWSEAWGLRRYGFHGLNHQWAAEQGARLLGRPVIDLRMVTCHLGSGSSLAAVAGGRSVDTTMGFTPLEGLVMGTRAGSLDPGLLLWLLTTGRVTLDVLDDALEHRSGLRGLAGTEDMRVVLARAAGGEAVARAALDVHRHRLVASIAAMTAAMGGIDALVWTGGIGEHSPDIRAAACEGLGWLGVELDAAANAAARGDAVVSSPSSAVGVAVVEAREDLVLAAGARALLEVGRPTA